MKRYLVFKWQYYEAGGGWNDFVGDFDRHEDIDVYPSKSNWIDDIVQIIDTETGVEEFRE